MTAYGRFLERLTREAAMYQADHELMVWAGSDTEAHATVGSLASWLGVSARPAELTSPLLEGEYEVTWTTWPLDPRQPYLVLLVSHEFSGEWSWADPLVTILRQSFPVSVVIDVERNLAANDALKELVKYENVLVDVLSQRPGAGPQGGRGAAGCAAGHGQSQQPATASTSPPSWWRSKATPWHRVSSNVETVRTMTAARLALVLLPGGQGELLKFFTTTRRREINLPEVPTTSPATAWPWSAARSASGGAAIPTASSGASAPAAGRIPIPSGGTALAGPGQAGRLPRHVPGQVGLRQDRLHERPALPGGRCGAPRSS
jgi:hypothetical protein